MRYLWNRALIYSRLKRLVMDETSSGFGFRFAVRSVKNAFKS